MSQSPRRATRTFSLFYIDIFTLIRYTRTAKKLNPYSVAPSKGGIFKGAGIQGIPESLITDILWKINAFAQTEAGVSMTRPQVVSKILESYPEYSWTASMHDRLRARSFLLASTERHRNPQQFHEELEFHQRQLESLKDRFLL